MSFMKKFLAAGILLGWLAVALPASGNGGGYAGGFKSVGAFQPIGIEQVEMVSEDLSIDLHIEYAEVRIEYVLHNPGKKIKVKAGFPSAVMTGSSLGIERPDPRPIADKGLRDFVISADNEKLAIKVTQDDLKLNPGNMEVNFWHTVEIKFDQGQTRRVSVSYRQSYFNMLYHGAGSKSASDLSLAYLFSAAGLWAGPIHRGDVVVRAISIDPREVQFSHPKRFRKEGSAWIWNFRDLEPTLEDDLVIAIRPETDSFLTEDRTQYVAYGAEKSKNRRWEIHRHPDAVEASSTLVETQSGQKHSAENVMSDGRSFAWVEGVEGDGIGEALTLKMKKPVKVSRIGLVNGYAASPKLYAANNRIAELAVSVNGGEPFNVALPDELLRTGYFFFDLPKSPVVNSVRLEIRKVYPGAHFKDTALSEVLLVVPLAKAPKIQPVR
jgi:hypothetical protein